MALLTQGGFDPRSKLDPVISGFTYWKMIIYLEK